MRSKRPFSTSPRSLSRIGGRRVPIGRQRGRKRRTDLQKAFGFVHAVRDFRRNGRIYRRSFRMVRFQGSSARKADSEDYGGEVPFPEPSGASATPQLSISFVRNLVSLLRSDEEEYPAPRIHSIPQNASEAPWLYPVQRTSISDGIKPLSTSPSSSSFDSE